MINELVDELWAIREEKRELARTEKELNQRYKDTENALISALETQGLDGVKTTKARATLSESEVVKLEDWEAFCDYVRENNAFHLLQKTPAANACKELQNITGTVIPGVNTLTLRKISLSTR